MGVFGGLLPAEVKPRSHALVIDRTASLNTAFHIAPTFGMTEKDAR